MTRETIFVIDDDDEMRDAIGQLLLSIGYQVALFGSPAEFLDARPDDPQGCLILDVRLPGISGLQLQSRLGEMGSTLPIIFMSGHGDVPMTVQAIKAGAEDFLVKPMREQQLLDAVTAALERGARHRADRDAISALRSHYDSLSARERAILQMASQGWLNKTIAANMGLSEITVKVNRRQMMRKMGARTFAELARISERLVQAGLMTTGQ